MDFILPILDSEIHIHRIGRTGRAGKEGLAISLFTASELFRVKAIEEFQNSPVRIEQAMSVETRENFNLSPPMVMLFINAGRKEKLRAGDILGALTANTDLPGKKIGKIDIFDKQAYVARRGSIYRQAGPEDTIGRKYQRANVQGKETSLIK
jgi:ATP-independent RNA helicase DbpA